MPQGTNGQHGEPLSVVAIDCRAGVAALLRACELAHPGIRVLAAESWSDVSPEDHDVLVVDLGAGGSANGLLGGDAPGPQPRGGILVITCCPERITPWQVQVFVKHGVTGIIDLDATVDDLATALQDVARRAVTMHFRSRRSRQPDLALLADASQRDFALLRLVASGLSDREIGRQLFMSEHTVKHHIERLREKRKSRNRIELAAWAGSHGLHGPADEG
ncbi:MAG TPA: response regulator transcription factor [Candidatus Dormibacteraeota bacterium]